MAHTPLRWSQAAEQWLLEFNDALVCDVLVVGTGYGGSFAAEALAGPDTRVWVLERGREYRPGDFPSDIGSLPGHVRIQTGVDTQGMGNRDGLLDFRHHDQVSVLVANGLGGGSLINAGVALKPDESLCLDERWPAHYRLDAANRHTLWQAMDEVLTRLQAAPFQGAQSLQKFQALERLGQAMGETAHRVPLTIASENQTSTAGIDQPACTRCGNCFTGCNIGAKNTLVSHVLPQAVRQGARLVTGVTALSVMPQPGADTSPHGRPLRWAVEVALTDALGNPTRQTVWVKAHTVVLAAGALGSTELLLRSPTVACSPQLGQRFSTNGDVLALGWGMAHRVNGMASPDEATLPPRDRVGPTITGALSPVLAVGEGKRRVLIEDGAVPSALTQAVLAFGATLSLPHRYTRDAPLGYFAANPELDPLSTPTEMARHALLLLGMGPDDANGTVSLCQKEERTALDIRWAAAAKGQNQGPGAPYYQAIHDWLDAAARQGGFDGGDCLPNPLWRPLPTDFAEVAQGMENPRGITVHPLGGCAMADDPQTGTVDWRGTVFKAGGGVHEGLHVLDGGILPSAVGVNPFVTIAALSLVAARDIRRGLPPPSALNVAPEVGQPVPFALSPLAPVSRPVVLRFREHLQGHWQGDAPDWLPAGIPGLSGDERQREWVVAVEVELDLAAWLANPGMRLEGARLRLYRNTHPHEISVRPEATLGDPVLEGEGWLRLLASDPPKGGFARAGRMALAGLAFLDRRSLTEAWHLVNPDGGSTAPNGASRTPWERVKAFARAARNHAEWRSLDYTFSLRTPGAGSLAVRASGRKRLAYTPNDKSLWDALVQIDLQLTPHKGTPAVLSLEADLVDMVRQRRLQVAQAAHTPDAIIGLAAFGALWLRAIFQTHFWSLRGLDYQLLSPPGPASHGPLWPLGASQPAVRPSGETALRVRRRQQPCEDETLTHLTLALTRYDPPRPGTPSRHVLLVHGLAHGGTVFTTHTSGGRNMAAAFLAEGHTVWVLDHRLSNRLWCEDGETRRRMATLDHCMDDVARIDIPAAVAHVHAVAGEPIDVFAHCVGAGAFAMATLQGLLEKDGHSMVRAAALHAVHPWVVPSASNQLSGELAALYRDVLPRDMSIDPVPPAGQPGAMDQLLDRVAASLPWPTSEAALHNAHQTDAAGGTATCNRMTLFYGREWVHANLAEATHKELASLVGPASIEVFQQLYFVINRQRLTDRLGAGVYMSAAQFRQHWTFPTLFCHGSENRVFDPRSAVRSWHQLRLQHEMHRPGDLSRPAVRLFLAEGYGHMDFLFGKDAHRDIYPSLVSFLQNPQAFQSVGGSDGGTANEAHQTVASHWRDHTAQHLQAPLAGPVLQVQGGQGSRRELVVWAELPRQPLWGDAEWVAQDTDRPDAPLLPGWHAQPLTGVHPADSAREADVTLLKGPGSYWVGRWREPAPGAFARTGRVRLALAHPAAAALGLPSESAGAPVLDLAGLPWWQRWTGTTTHATTSWLATSCRWPGLPFEREAVDHLAVHMLAHVHDAAAPAEALVLLGDQIYADATANVFDTQTDDERLAQFYRDAWGSPHARRLLASVPTYTVVDDHELGDNWNGSAKPLEDPMLMNGFEAALAYQWRWTDPVHHAPCVSADAVRGFWREFALGAIPAFAMDTRTERESRATHPLGPDGAQMVSQAQWKALEAWLLEHRAEPKVLCSGSVFGWAEHSLLNAPAGCAHADGWSGYPASWKRLVKFIVAHQVQHTVFLSGDFHFSGVASLRLSAEGPQPAVTAVSVVCSGWNASLPFANARASDFALNTPTALPLSSADAQVLSTAQCLGEHHRQFSKLTLGARPDGGWQLHVGLFDESGAMKADATLSL